MYNLMCSVSGIHNKEGKTQIKNALKKIKGIHEVGVNRATGTVHVDYNDPVTEVEIKNCIENTGYKVIY